MPFQSKGHCHPGFPLGFSSLTVWKFLHAIKKSLRMRLHCPPIPHQLFLSPLLCTSLPGFLPLLHSSSDLLLLPPQSILMAHLKGQSHSSVKDSGYRGYQLTVITGTSECFPSCCRGSAQGLCGSREVGGPSLAFEMGSIGEKGSCSKWRRVT